MKYLNVFLIVYSLLITNVFGATITDDTLKIGKPGSSANKEITLGTNKKIRANESTGKIEFSNDGSLYKNLGSGSGSGGSSGINILTNESFEDGIGSPWTSSGGTFTQESYAIPSESDTKYGQFVATTSGQYIEQIASVPTNFSAGCQADFKKVNIATAGLFKVQALNVSNNVLAEQVVGISAWVKVPTISFPCPASGANNLKLRLTSLAAGTIQFDRAYIGSNQNIVNISQARVFGRILINGPASPNFSVTSTTYSTFPVSAGVTYTPSGNASSPSTNIPAIKFSNMPAGDYQIVYSGSVTSTASTNAFCSYRFYDGVSTTESQIVNAPSATFNATSPIVSGVISYATAQSNITIQMQAKSSSGACGVGYSLNEVTAITVYYWPSGQETAVSPEQASWFIDANIGGGNPTSSTTSSYIEYLNSTLDLVLNSGSALAQIACANGTDSTGLTCTSSESVGITFTNSLIGRHLACFDFVQNMNNGMIINQVVETTPTSSAIIQEGKTRTGTYTSNSTTLIYTPNRICGTFNFSDIKRRTLRLMYESTMGNGSIISERDSNNGQRDIHITVENLDFGQNRPILTGDQVTTKGAVNPEHFAFSYGGTNMSNICSSGSCFLDQIGNYVASVTRSAVGVYTVLLNKTYSKIKCQSKSQGGNAGYNINVIDVNNTNTFTFTSRNVSQVDQDTWGGFSCDVLF